LNDPERTEPAKTRIFGRRIGPSPAYAWR
jgi:hypothetical protein